MSATTVLRAAALCSLVLVSNGCGSVTPAAATRVLDPDSAALSGLPVCFAPPEPNLGLTERAQRGTIQAICEEAARSEGVHVVPATQGQCLSASLTWALRDTGDHRAACSPTWGGGAECYSRALHIKSIKVSLAQPGGKVLAETTASIRSDRAEFTRETFGALCSAAFHDFPQPMSNEQFEVPVD